MIAFINSGALTIITLIYAILTYRIAASSKRAAAASERAADSANASIGEIEAQRFTSIVPFLVIEKVQSRWRDVSATFLSIQVRNAGVGSAMGITVTLSPDDSVGSEAAPAPHPAAGASDAELAISSKTTGPLLPTHYETLDLQGNDNEDDEGIIHPGHFRAKIAFFDVLGRVHQVFQEVEITSSRSAMLGEPRMVPAAEG